MVFHLAITVVLGRTCLVRDSALVGFAARARISAEMAVHFVIFVLQVPLVLATSQAVLYVVSGRSLLRLGIVHAKPALQAHTSTVRAACFVTLAP